MPGAGLGPCSTRGCNGLHGRSNAFQQAGMQVPRAALACPAASFFVDCMNASRPTRNTDCCISGCLNAISWHLLTTAQLQDGRRPQQLDLMSGMAMSSPAEAILGNHLAAKRGGGPPSRRLQPAGDASQVLRLVGARPRLEVVSLLGSHGQRPSLPAARVRLHDLGNAAGHGTHPGGAVTGLQLEVGSGRLCRSPCVTLQAAAAEELAQACCSMPSMVP